MNYMKRLSNGGSVRRPPAWLWILLTLGMLVRLFWLDFAQGHINRLFWSNDLLVLLLSLSSILLTWYFAAALAARAELSRQGTERFMVMSTLVMVAPPIPILTQQLTSWLTGALSLVLLVLLFALQRWRQAKPSANAQVYRWSGIGLLSIIILAILLYMQSLDQFTGNVPLSINQFPWFTLFIAATSLLLAAVSCLLAYWWPQPILRRLRQLTSLSLLCTACIAFLYSGSYIMHGFTGVNTLSLPTAITNLFVLSWPYFIAAFFTLPYLITQYRYERSLLYGKQITTTSTPKTVALHVAMLIIIGLYFITQLYTYITGI